MLNVSFDYYDSVRKRWIPCKETNVIRMSYLREENSLCLIFNMKYAQIMSLYNPVCNIEVNKQ